MGLDYKKLSVRLFGWLADLTEDQFYYLKEALPKADIRMLLRTYLSLSYTVSFLAGIVIGLFYFIRNFFLLKNPLAYSLVMSLGAFFISALLVFGFMIIYPSSRVEERRRNIETNLPFAITHMAATASSGVPPSTMFRLLTEFKEYGEISKEAEKIVNNIDLFGVDIATAIREVARKSPSQAFKDFLEGIATTIDTGGDLNLFLKQQSEKAMFEYKIRREKYLQTLSTYADFYTAVLIAAPLFLVAILSVMSMIEGQIWGMNIQDLMKIGIFFIIPAVNLAFLLFLHFTQPEM